MDLQLKMVHLESNPRVATNKNNKNYVAWQWDTNGGTTTAFGGGDNPEEHIKQIQLEDLVPVSIQEQVQ